MNILINDTTEIPINSFSEAMIISEGRKDFSFSINGSEPLGSDSLGKLTELLSNIESLKIVLDDGGILDMSQYTVLDRISREGSSGRVFVNAGLQAPIT